MRKVAAGWCLCTLWFFGGHGCAFSSSQGSQVFLRTYVRLTEPCLSPGCRCHEDMPTWLSPGPAHSRLGQPLLMSDGAQTHRLSREGSKEEAGQLEQPQSRSSAFTEEGAGGRAEGSGRPLSGCSGFCGWCPCPEFWQ